MRNFYGMARARLNIGLSASIQKDCQGSGKQKFAVGRLGATNAANCCTPSGACDRLTEQNRESSLRSPFCPIAGAWARECCSPALDRGHGRRRPTPKDAAQRHSLLWRHHVHSIHSYSGPSGIARWRAIQRPVVTSDMTHRSATGIFLSWVQSVRTHFPFGGTYAAVLMKGPR